MKKILIINIEKNIRMLMRERERESFENQYRIYYGL